MPPMANAGSVISQLTAQEEVQPGELIEVLGRGGERRAAAEIVRSVQHGLPGLFARVRGDADQPLRADQRAGVLHR